MRGLLCALALLPFTQIGISYYASGQILVLLSLLLMSRQNGAYLMLRDLLPRLAATYALLFSVSIYQGVGTADLTRAVREAICFFLITGMAAWKLSLNVFDYRRVVNLLYIMAICVFLLVVVQTVALGLGIYVGLPQDLFVINRDTLPDALDLIYSRIRPMGTFGEPSYLAVFSLCLIFGLRHMWQDDRRVRITITLLALVVLLSRSLSGIIWVSLLMIIILKDSRYRGYSILGLIAVAILGTLASIYFETGIFDRLHLIAQGRDLSFAARVGVPVLAVPELLAEYPTGIPILKFAAMPYVLDRLVPTAQLVQNSLFKFSIVYGFFGLGALAVLFYCFRRRWTNAVLLLALMFQNGSFLAIDKVALIAIAMTLSNSLQSTRIGGYRPVSRPAPAGAGISAEALHS